MQKARCEQVLKLLHSEGCTEIVLLKREKACVSDINIKQAIQFRPRMYHFVKKGSCRVAIARSERSHDASPLNCDCVEYILCRPNHVALDAMP